MRKKEREISERSEIDAIIRSSQVCRLGMTDGHEPYIIPLCFGYDGQALYFHSAKEGRKLDILRRNNKVCFEFDILEAIVADEQACRWGARFQSIMGTGIAHIIESQEEKIRALQLLMQQYSPAAYTFPDQLVATTAIIRVDIETVSGKHGRLA